MNLKHDAGLVARDPETTRGWRFEIDGQSAPAPRRLTILLERTPGNPETYMGRLDYGAVPSPTGEPGLFDTFIFHELGGSVTLPFALIQDQLYVGVLSQQRFAERHPEHNASGVVLNAPRGFHNLGENASKTAQRELEEEAGMFEGATFRLAGASINANNAWFSYSDELQDGLPVGQGGVKLFAVEVDARVLEPDGAGYRMQEALMKRPEPLEGAVETIGKCTFLHWQEALQLRDGFTICAIARLVGHLHAGGRTLR